MIESIGNVHLASEIFGIREYIHSIMTNTNSCKKLDILEIEVTRPIFFDFLVKRRIKKFKEYVAAHVDEHVKLLFKEK